MTKKCSKCGLDGTEADFYRLKSGSAAGRLTSWCRACYRTANAKRRPKPPGLQRSDWKEWVAKNPDKQRDSCRRWVANNREKRAAHMAVGNAVRGGRLVRKPCFFCGDAKSHAHHDDYSKPLEVQWLCSKHHREHHRALAVER